MIKIDETIEENGGFPFIESQKKQMSEQQNIEYKQSWHDDYQEVNNHHQIRSGLWKWL
jgi:hypothetical protein